MLTEKVSVKSPDEFKIMNQSYRRRDSREKVTGEAKFAGDIQFPDMLYAKILRPPSHDATLLEVDLTAAQQIEGVQIIREGDFIAVLHNIRMWPKRH